MLIDVHTHIFPSKIAPKTIVLESGFLRVQHKPYYAHTTGTVDGLRQSMKEFGVDKRVVSAHRYHGQTERVHQPVRCLHRQ